MIFFTCFMNMHGFESQQGSHIFPYGDMVSCSAFWLWDKISFVKSAHDRVHIYHYLLWNAIVGHLHSNDILLVGNIFTLSDRFHHKLPGQCKIFFEETPGQGIVWDNFLKDRYCIIFRNLPLGQGSFSNFPVAHPHMFVEVPTGYE